MAIVAATSGCSDTGDATVSIRYLRSETHTFSSAERRLIHNTAIATVREVRALLPNLPTPIELTVRPGTDVIPEIGQGGDAMPPNGVMWTVDPTRQGGVTAIASAWLRACLFHELHHLARATAGIPRSILDHAVTEGMATAFERDFAGAAPLWGVYPDDVRDWATELSNLPEGSPRNDWLFRHPDGRRWIGHKVGTYWVDQARARSGKSAADLVTVPTSEILTMSRQVP